MVSLTAPRVTADPIIVLSPASLKTALSEAIFLMAIEDDARTVLNISAGNDTKLPIKGIFLIACIDGGTLLYVGITSQTQAAAYSSKASVIFLG